MNKVSILCAVLLCQASMLYAEQDVENRTQKRIDPYVTQTKEVLHKNFATFEVPTPQSQQRAIDTMQSTQTVSAHVQAYGDVMKVDLLQSDGSVRSYDTNKKNWYSE